MSPSPAVAEKLCCTTEDTDSRSNSPLPFRHHAQQPVTAESTQLPQQQQPLLHRQTSRTLQAGDDLVELRQIFAEADSTVPPPAGRTSTMTLLKSPRSRPSTATGVIDEKPKKKKLFKRLTRELSRSNLSLSNLRKSATAKDKEQKGQQQETSNGEKRAKLKSKRKEKSTTEETAAVELSSTNPEAREVLLSRTYDSDAASLPDIRGSVVERLTKTLALQDDDEGKVRVSPVRSKRNTDKRGDISSIDWSGNGDGPYGWGEPSSSAPILSLQIPERLSDLGVLPSCNASVEDLLQLYQPSGRNSPWKKFAEQHLPKRSKSAEMLSPSTPDLKPVQLSGLSSPSKGKAWRLSTDEGPVPKTGLTGTENAIQEDQAREEVQEPKKQGLPSLHAQDSTSSPLSTHRGTEMSYRTMSEALPETGNHLPKVGSSISRRASVNIPPNSLPDSESASVHLNDMRISQHLRSESTLSGISRVTSGATGAQPHDRLARGSLANTSGFEPPLLHAQHSNGTVRARTLRGSSSGFTSERVPEGWGNVVSTAPSSIYVASDKAYEPSSIYSTRQNSLASTPAASRLNITAGSSTPGGSGRVRKSGYEVLNLGDVGFLKADVHTDESETIKKGENSTMPGTFPPSMNELGRSDTGLTFRTAIESAEMCRSTSDHADEVQDERPSSIPSESSEQTIGAGQDEPLRPNQQNSEQTTDSSLDITPVTALESPVSSEKTPRAQIMTPVPSQQPISVKDKKKTPSIKTPSKRFSTFSFFRSKTYANLRRASHSPALHIRKTSKSEENFVLAGGEDSIVSTGAYGIDSNTDGPSDSDQKEGHLQRKPGPHSPEASRHISHTPDHSHGRGHAGVGQDSTVSEAVEEYRPGRLSRSWLIGDGRDVSGRVLGQNAVWEKALQKHREEKSALFLSPEKGGKAEARGLFRERSGSGSAVSTRSKQTDRKGKGPAIGADFSFGERSPGLQRSSTVLLDPLEKGFGEELVGQKEESGMLGDDLRHDRISGVLTPLSGISPGASLKRQPSVLSIEQDLHLDSWGGTTLADIDLGDLGAWSRYPSHTREQRIGPAGAADNVRTRDFAYEMINAAAIEDADSTDDDENSRGAIKRLTTLRSKKKSKTRSGMSKSKSMTFSRNFSFLKHYIGLFRSQSEEFRKHGHGHRSSIAESGSLEHPELEMLPPVFSPITFDIRDSSQAQIDGASSKADLSAQGEGSAITETENKAGQHQAEESTQSFGLPQIASPNRRQEGKTDSSDGSWAANARLWTRAFGSESDHGNHKLMKKTDSSTEWWSNARMWTRYGSPSQDFQDVLEDARQKTVFTPTRLERQSEERVDSVAEETTIAVPEKACDKITDRLSEESREKVPEGMLEGVLTAKRSKRAHQSSSDEWRSDARLFSQMYESCVQVPNFSSSEDANADDNAQKPTAHTREQSTSGNAAFRLASTGHMGGILARGTGNAEKVKLRSKSSSHSGSAVETREGFERNDSFLSVGGVEGSTMDLLRFLHDLEEGERAKLEVEEDSEL